MFIHGKGSEISIYYDPMICKLVTYGPNRQAALNTMNKALDNYVIRGVTNNISLLRDITTEKNFIDGKITTKYLYETYPQGFKGRTLSSSELLDLVGLGAAIHAKEMIRNAEFLNTRRFQQVLFFSFKF